MPDHRDDRAARRPPATSTDAGGADRPVGELVAGRYRLIDRLGAGAMGTVHLALHEVLQRQVAMKFLPEELAGNREIAALRPRDGVSRWRRRGCSTAT